MGDRLHEIMSILEDKIDVDPNYVEQTFTITGIATAARAIMALDGWRPIETAPKDGRLIWLGCATNLRLGFWESGRWVDEGRARQGGPRDLLFTPTHWQPPPLPPAPEPQP